MKIPALLFVAFLLSSCFYKSVPVTSKTASDTLNIEGIVTNLKPGKEYDFMLKRALPFMHDDGMHALNSIQLVYDSSTQTAIVGKRAWTTSRPRKRIEQTDSIPKEAVASVKQEKVDVVRTIGAALLLPFFVVGVVFLFLANGGRGF